MFVAETMRQVIAAVVVVVTVVVGLGATAFWGKFRGWHVGGKVRIVGVVIIVGIIGTLSGILNIGKQFAIFS